MADFALPNKKVELRPLKKSTAFIPDTKHEASFLAPRAKRRYSAPIGRNGQYVSFLTQEEINFLESDESGLGLAKNQLSFYKKENNYWDEFFVELGKLSEIWDLSDPINYIKYKMLLANKDDIAESTKLAKRKPTYKYAFVDLEEVVAEQAREVDLEESAWEHFSKIKKSRTKMINILKLFGKRASDNSSDDFLKTEIRNIMESQNGYEKFVNACTDEDFDLKVQVEDALIQGVLVKDRNKYMFADGELLGVDLFDTIKTLKDPKNQNTLLMLKTKLKNSK